MREILFRGKQVDNGEWVEGDFCHPCNIVFEAMGYDEVLGQKDVPVINDYAVIPETVGQYTGLTDKNGTKIFEGNIVNFKTTAYHFKNCRIKYQSCYARYCAIDNKGYEYPMDKTFEYEVIGNIHDNPELLKGGAE